MTTTAKGVLAKVDDDLVTVVVADGEEDTLATMSLVSSSLMLW